MGRERYTNRPRRKTVRKALRRRATPAERCLWRIVRDRRLDGAKFRRQHGVGPYVLDLYCPSARLAVEIDGAVHDDPLRADYDRVREADLTALGIRVVRFSNRDVIGAPEVVAEAIRALLRERDASR
ncbi:endonuclease domain-containing protein [Rubrivirga sp. IMCC43871]|uniref:endonuclease domain-containing protein n=1 Tax=Rubrivirga sp. IMCC43871 TaxID=3391575 RepID=UPI00398FB8E2